MPSHSDDYRVVRSIAVTASDVVMAYEANQSRRDQRAVIRLTPPFNGRMRARLHLVREGDAYQPPVPAPLHIDPEAFIDAAPPYPHAEDTEAAIRAESDTQYTVEAHYERHRSAVSAWREAVLSRLSKTVTLAGRHGQHTVDVKVLGNDSGLSK
ncbi:hypothetical protein [Haladaptatus sp. DJG-WS-42]|uniref:hypothetical protein n=1 Tax=Haladaptatus sp. DJG-WS-42 TaxID=3120516 RepID=UPI0030CE5A9D